MATAGAKVVVACKIAVAWLELQLCEERDVAENTQTGPRMIKEWVKTGRIVRVRGTAYPAGTPPEGFPDKPKMINGYALTENVDKDFWDEWKRQHAKSAYIQSGMIIAFEKLDGVQGHAREHVGELSGLEPLKQKNDPRAPKPTIKGVTIEGVGQTQPEAA